MTPPAVIPALARVVRGLSAVFWGLPAVLLFDAKAALEDSWNPVGFGPVLAASALVLYGVHQFDRFQPQERIWAAAVERARLSAMLLLALAPFAVWWGRRPEEPFFAHSMVLLLVAGLAFLLALNHLLVRLAAMLPDILDPSFCLLSLFSLDFSFSNWCTLFFNMFSMPGLVSMSSTGVSVASISSIFFFTISACLLCRSPISSL